MAREITLTKFVEHPDGRFEIVYTLNGGGGQGITWSSRADMLADTSVILNNDDNAIKFLMAYWTGRDPNYTSPNIMLNKKMTIDFTAPDPIKLQS